MSHSLRAALRTAGACFALAASTPVCGVVLELAGPLVGLGDIRLLPKSAPGYLFNLVFVTIAMIGAFRLALDLAKCPDREGVPMSRVWCGLLAPCSVSPVLEDPIRQLPGESWRLHNIAFIAVTALSSVAFVLMLKHVSESGVPDTGRRGVAIRSHAIFLLATLFLPAVLLVLELKYSPQRLRQLGDTPQRPYSHTYIMSVYYISMATCLLRCASRCQLARKTDPPPSIEI